VRKIISYLQSFYVIIYDHAFYNEITWHEFALTIVPKKNLSVCFTLLSLTINVLNEANKYDTEEVEGLLNAASIPVCTLSSCNSVRNWPFCGSTPY
jgi:hypothetical protein